MTDVVQTSVDAEGVATVALDRGKVNAINPDVSKALEAAFRDLAARDEARAVVLTAARDGVFSAGFDLAELAKLDRPAFEAHYHAFLDALRAMDEVDKPLIAAINGHAIAGGAILGWPADYRILAEGKRIGVTEVDLAVPVPVEGVHLLARFLPARHLRTVLLEARVFDAEEAQRIGLVDEAVHLAQVKERAHELARALAAKPAHALRVTRDAIRRVTAPQGLTLAEADAEHLDSVFVDAWFSDEAQGRIATQLERLARQ